MSTSQSTATKPAALEESEEQPKQRPEMRASGKIVLRTTPAAIGASALAMLAFVVLLDFLVFISFVGQELWQEKRLFNDLWFSLPAYLWFGVLVLSIMAFLRIATQRIVVSSEGLKVKGWFRIPQRLTRWEDLHGFWLVRDVYRGKEPKNPVDTEIDAPEAFLIMRNGMRRIANASGAFYGARTQSVLLQLAEEHNVRVEHLEHARPNELAHMLPGSQTFLDRYPNIVVSAIVLFYVAHNVLTFMIWGL